MKNIRQAILLALALLAPTTGFAMEADPSAASAADTDTIECPICREDILPTEAPETLIQLTHKDSKILHTSHGECARLWLARYNTCPNCNAQLTADDRTILGLAPIPETAPIRLEDPIFQACRDGNLATVRALLDGGTDVNATTNGRVTPLHIACHNGNIRLAELLLRHAADVNATAIDGRTPLHLACFNSQIEAAELLLERGADINATDNGGRTPLHWACILAHTVIAELLLRHGANINTTNNHGHTALEIACWGIRDLSIIDLLLRYGVTPTLSQRLEILKLRIKQHDGKIAAGLAALAAAWLAYYQSME